MRSWLERTIWRTKGCISIPDRMWSEVTGCCFISAHSSSVSGPGLLRMRSGTPILPMSWSGHRPRSPPGRHPGSQASGRARPPASARARRDPPLYSSFASIERESAAIVPRYVRWTRTLLASSCSFTRRPPRPTARAIQVPAHREGEQHGRDCKRRETEEAHPVVCEGRRVGEGAKGEVVRHRPPEALLPDLHDRRVLLDAHRDAEEADVDRLVRDPGDQGDREAEGDRRLAAAERLEDAGRRCRRERKVGEVEHGPIRLALRRMN